jgi:hypothetical protein
MDEQPTGGVKLPASDCGRIANDIEAAIADFVRVGLPADWKGPMPPAASVLREVARRGAYGTTDDELLSVTAAVRVARDYCGIAKAMPPALDEAYGAELAKIFDGGLRRGDYHGSHDIRAQLAFAARLSAAGYPPRVVPTGDGKTPDYLIPIANGEFGLEVKRPGTVERTMKKLDEAASQLRAIATPGFIALDLSRLFAPLESTPTPLGGSAALRQHMRAIFADLTFRLSTYCERQQMNPVKREKFSYVIGACCFVEISHWMADDRSAPLVLTLHTGGPVMWSSLARNLLPAAFGFTDLVSRSYTGAPYKAVPILVPQRYRERH